VTSACTPRTCENRTGFTGQLTCKREPNERLNEGLNEACAGHSANATRPPTTPGAARGWRPGFPIGRMRKCENL
jgi:hypothetical protein